MRLEVEILTRPGDNLTESTVQRLQLLMIRDGNCCIRVCLLVLSDQQGPVSMY